jgi:poly(glycerol-phosphate) alpha-glucosyltransferase
MLDPWAVKNSAWKKRLAGWLFESSNLRGAACIRALCESEAQSIRKFGLTNPIAIIPNGIDLPPGFESDEDCTEGTNVQGSIGVGRPEFPHAGKSLDSEVRNLLYLGRIHPKKGLVNLLRAWRETEIQRVQSLSIGGSNFDSWTLSIAGWDEGGHEKQLKQLATDLELKWCDVRDGSPGQQGARVLFLGPQFKDAKSRCYRSSEAFILPSYSEGLPMVVLEAWAYGKPVLMTPHCNLPEGFQAASAIRIETTVESIVEGLRCMMSATPADRKQMGRRGRELVRQRFTWSEVAKQFRDVSHWAVHGGVPPDCLRLDG